MNDCKIPEYFLHPEILEKKTGIRTQQIDCEVIEKIYRCFFSFDHRDLTFNNVGGELFAQFLVYLSGHTPYKVLSINSSPRFDIAIPPIDMTFLENGYEICPDDDNEGDIPLFLKAFKARFCDL